MNWSKVFLPLRGTGLFALALLSIAASPGSKLETAGAVALFDEANTICKRDAGKFWGISICAPILLVDPYTSDVIANQADAGGLLTADGDVFNGRLTKDVVIANTPTEWSGTRWTQLIAPVSDDLHQRHVTLAHELFHRVQPGLGLSRKEVANRHLDTLEGRYLLQLEWRALAAALKAKGDNDRAGAIADALTFRQERYRLFTEAAEQETALEINEGIPEYTGVMLGLDNDRDRVAFALRDLAAFVNVPTFVRTFAYATGPAYGLLLDRYDPRWRTKLASGKRFDQLLEEATKGRAVKPYALRIRIARYDDGQLRQSEEQREKDKQKMLAEYKARLVDGPVLILPMRKSNFRFNPQELKPLEDFGTIYPTLGLTDDWGVLDVKSGGALVMSDKRSATVPAGGVDVNRAKGNGWQITLKDGWEIARGQRHGDWIVKKIER